MPVSRYCATQFRAWERGYIYALRNPDDGYIFYVGKTKSGLKSRYTAHLGDCRPEKKESDKVNYIRSILNTGKKPFISIIEYVEIRTNYDRMYYDYKEFFWIRKYLEMGWELTNIRTTDSLYSENQYKKILETAKNGGGLLPNDFYYGNDRKDFPIYDLKRIKELGYRYSEDQYASHWNYIIDLEKYSNIEETTLHYVYSDICCEENRNSNSFYE